MVSTTSNSSTVEPTTAPSTAFTDFVLRQLRCAKLRGQITVNQIEMAATVLSAGMISAEAALLILAETGAAGLIPASLDI